MNSEDEDFMEDRFGEVDHTLWEEHIRKHDLQNENKVFDKKYAVKQLYFCDSIPQAVVNRLKNLISDILSFSADQGLKLLDQNHQVQFLDVITFEQQSGKPISSNIPLPASQLQFNPISRIYTVTIVLPNKIQTNEEIINITRTLFAKFMGDIYLNEQVLRHDFYREATRYHENEVLASFTDQLETIAGNEFHSTTLDTCCKAHAKKYKRGATPMNVKKNSIAIKRELTKNWLTQWENKTLLSEEEDQIYQIFQDYLNHFQQNPKTVLKDIINRIGATNSQINFILPHEMRAYNLFEEKAQTQYIQAASHKISEIIALIGFIEEMADQLENPVDPDDLEGLLEQVQEQIRELKNNGKIKLFLLSNIALGPQLKEEQQNFPLRLIKLLPKTLPVQQWSKETGILQKKYEKSIYQKIAETLIVLKHWLEALMKRQKKQFMGSEEYKEINKLLKNFKFRASSLNQLNITLKIIQEYGESLQLTTRHSVFPIQIFKKAWSYTCSSILIHMYYEKLNQESNLPKKFNSKKYMQVIEQYVFRQIKHNIDYAKVVFLLLLIYRQKQKEGLNFLLYMINNPTPSLGYAFNQVIEPQPIKHLPTEQHSQEQLNIQSTAQRNAGMPDHAQLKKYCDFLIQVYDERIETDILPGRDY